MGISPGGELNPAFDPRAFDAVVVSINAYRDETPHPDRRCGETRCELNAVRFMFSALE